MTRCQNALLYRRVVGMQDRENSPELEWGGRLTLCTETEEGSQWSARKNSNTPKLESKEMFIREKKQRQEKARDLSYSNILTHI